ncbi:MAG: class I SAM-dependent methyltransferase, partial [Solirubrobacterales bacterium]|nr:class I SAM-dependent methyltransferase [Solirubrobacterales bacterium]
DRAARGAWLADALVTHARIAGDSHVLEVGSGVGETARALAPLLGPEGRYDGLEVDRAAVGWCRRAYRRDRRFRFVVADVHDPRHNPQGVTAPADYRFPYADMSVDAVLMPRALAHGLPEACEQHLAEAARVLREGGAVVAPFFALNDVSRTLIARGEAGLAFADPEEDVAVLDDGDPEEAVAYAEEWIFERLREHGLTLEGLHPGSWCGREEHMGFQDLLVAVRHG